MMLQKTLKFYLERIRWPQLDKRRNKAAKDSSSAKLSSPTVSTARIAAAAVSAHTSPPPSGAAQARAPTPLPAPSASPLPSPGPPEVPPQPHPDLTNVRRFPIACGGVMGELLLPPGPKKTLMVRQIMFNLYALISSPSPAQSCPHHPMSDAKACDSSLSPCAPVPQFSLSVAAPAAPSSRSLKG